jgi:asparagine synthase (glutamine-hydrolysing)
MCGITGKLNFDRQASVDPNLLRQMTRSIEHRGPDGEGVHLSGPVGLGHRRLAIIDLSTGDQPMCNEDGSVWVVFNGEIYNFAALRADLVARGHVLRSNSDTEVIVHLYEELGDRCVEKFQGMFAFALWDERRQRLLLARDRVGIKPLYFTNTGRSIVFGSEIKSILADPSVPRSIDWVSIDRFLTYYYLPGERTLIDGIRKLEPGHYLTVQNGKVTITAYWDLTFEQSGGPQPSLEDSAQALRGLLDRSVRSHLISDVPVGVLLSGGVDSSGVLGLASKWATEPLHSFTMGFDGKGVTDERPYARLAAKTFATHHHETTVSAADFCDFLPRYVWHMEEPVCEPPAIALYFVSKLARDTGVKVLLSGEGGDEAFAGYQDYRNLLALESLKTGLGPARGLLKTGFRTLHRAGWQRAQHYSDLTSLATNEYYFSRTATPSTPFNRLKSMLYSEGLASRLQDIRSDEPTRHLLARVQDQPLLNRLLYVDTKSWLPDDLLVKADKMTMATSVELRVPLLDHQVLEFAAGLPQRHKVRGWQLKRVLKKALAPIVPKAILERKKAGFPVPYAHWMRHELKDHIRDTVMAQSSFCRSVFSPRVLEQILQSNEQAPGCPKEVFSLLVLEHWYQQFCRGASGVSPSFIETKAA